MPKSGKRKVAIVTGPTGGHFFPGLAVAEELSGLNNTEVFFFVPGKEYIKCWLKKKHFRYVVIPSGRLSSRDFLSPFKFFYAVVKAILQVSSGNFDILFITGSYITVPFLFAAFLCGVKTVVHEQNYMMGKVTMLSRYLASQIALSFPEYRGSYSRKAVFTGFPVLSDFKKKCSREKAIAEMGFSGSRLTVLVLGGSQGSGFLNRLISENFLYLGRKNLQFLHLAGPGEKVLRKTYKKFGITAMVFGFYFDMARLYNIADIIICRAGAGTLSEINEWKIPAIAVPYPYAGSHQVYNALFFERKGCCRILYQKEENIKKFPAFLDDFIDRTGDMKKSAEKVSIVDSGGKTVSLIMDAV